ncbi:hypothetical protein D3C72_2044220 [compost metagenome]
MADLFYRLGQNITFALLNPHDDLAADTGQTCQFFLAERQQRAARPKCAHDLGRAIHETYGCRNTPNCQQLG